MDCVVVFLGVLLPLLIPLPILASMVNQIQGTWNLSRDIQGMLAGIFNLSYRALTKHVELAFVVLELEGQICRGGVLFLIGYLDGEIEGIRHHAHEFFNLGLVVDEPPLFIGNVLDLEVDILDISNIITLLRLVTLHQLLDILPHLQLNLLGLLVAIVDLGAELLPKELSLLPNLLHVLRNAIILLADIGRDL